MGKSARTGQHGPRDTATVLGARYWLTDKGEAVVAALRGENVREKAVGK